MERSRKCAHRWFLLFWVLASSESSLVSSLCIPVDSSTQLRRRQRTFPVHYVVVPNVASVESATVPLSPIEFHVNGDENTQESDNYMLRFGGVGRLLASKLPNPSIDAVEAILSRLRNAVVIVIGLGGVGSWAAEALCRSGIGRLVLVDLDDICISNTNRQLHALASTTGQMKIDALRDRFEQINPDCIVTLVHDFVTADSVDAIFGRVLADEPPRESAIVVLDAIDGAKEKAAILSYCDLHQLPVVTCGGAAGRSDPSRVQRTDITLVQGDKLLASCKKELRKHHGFHAGLSFREVQKGRRVKKWNIDCVYSDEEIPEGSATNTTSNLRQCDGALGTACFLTGTFGFAAAAAIVDKVAYNALAPPRGRR
jgi:tRNA threonylcarbamoyladenosine dehydratase